MLSVTQVADRLFEAIEDGDIAAVADLYTLDTKIWHNDTRAEQSAEMNLKSLAALCEVLKSRAYLVKRRSVVDSGVLQQHVLSGVLADGDKVELHAAMYLEISAGKVRRIEEYTDNVAAGPVRALVRTLLLERRS
jgi:ketosteroid isomerase-like protein